MDGPLLAPKTGGGRGGGIGGKARTFSPLGIFRISGFEKKKRDTFSRATEGKPSLATLLNNAFVDVANIEKRQYSLLRQTTDIHQGSNLAVVY